MICFPNAKINLGLNIVSKREDGYHNLETIFYPIEICDALEIIETRNRSDEFIQTGLRLDASFEDNLVMKALRLMRESYSFPSLEVHLLKKIPFGAGVGGGSSDASHMLKLINDKFHLNIAREEMLAMALNLGADCPFFIDNKVSFAQGIGENLESIDLSLNKYAIALVKPDVYVSTKDAFALVKAKKPIMGLKDIVKKPIEDWKNWMINDFEESVFLKFPVVENIKEELYKQGAIYASMTGSGPSVFGIFNQDRISKLEIKGQYCCKLNVL